MNAIVDRRGFLGSAAALGAGLSVINHAPPLFAAQASPAHALEPAKDWAITHITDEAVRIARALQSQPRPEHVLALAANLRLFASYAKEHRLDQRFGEAMTGLVSRYGRDRMVAEAVSEKTTAHLGRMLTAAGLQPRAETVPAAVYDRQLDAILGQTALSTVIAESARVLEAAYAAEHRKRRGADSPMMHIQNADLEQKFRCTHFNEQCAYWSSQASFYCAVTYYVPFFGAACAGVGASAAAYCYVSWYYGC
jgi:hypothetical protein